MSIILTREDFDRVSSDLIRRTESCGGHFREEYQTSEGEALRNDDKFAFACVEDT